MSRVKSLLYYGPWKYHFIRLVGSYQLEPSREQENKYLMAVA